MQEERRRMAGKFYVIPFEVHDLLDEMKSACWDIYTTILRRVFIEEEGWDKPEEKWVSGVFRVESGHLITWSGVKKTHFYRCWGELVEAGLIEIDRNVNNGAKRDKRSGFRLPHYKKKADVGLTVAEVKELASRQDYLQDELERLMELMETAFEGRQDVNSPSGGTQQHDPPQVDSPSQGTDRPLGGTDRPLGGTPPARVSDPPPPREGRSLSLKEIVNAFYKAVGQEKISEEKRESGICCAEKLRKEGFSLDEIAFAAKWTVENFGETPYDFAIIKKTIGQALAARKKEQAFLKKVQEQDEEIREQEQLRKEEERQAEKIKGIKLSMGLPEKAELRAQAIEELKKSGAKDSFINEIVIGVKENEILRRRMETSSPE